LEVREHEVPNKTIGRYILEDNNPRGRGLKEEDRAGELMAPSL
jgi:hypothetical protein